MTLNLFLGLVVIGLIGAMLTMLGKLHAEVKALREDVAKLPKG